MIYESLDKLLEHYPKREKIDTFEEEFELVNDLFDTYEHIGFVDSLYSSYDQYQSKVGEPFTVVRRMGYVTDDIDLECLPQWKIKFEDGTEIQAYPEEICRVEIYGKKGSVNMTEREKIYDKTFIFAHRL